MKLSDFHHQLLRVVYRLIFLFVSEDRELEGISILHPQDKSEKARLARERYAAHYSTSRLRELASRIKGSRHGDLWRQFQLLVGAVSGDERFATMRDKLALPSLGSMLWNPASTALLNGPGLGDPGTELANVDFLEALRHLAFIRKDKMLRPVDYKNLGSEEFGGVYESFLALTPQISSDGARFTFAEFAGNERKTSGSYYTPDSLVQCLLDSALDPVVQERLAGKTGKEAEKAILLLKVCDKACGSGHFLVGAAHRLARHLARVRALAAGESEPSPLLYQTALRDVIGHCLYGVDINPMSVELCKVTLWLEALEPGKPLSFLDHHIRCGNSLLGATPELIKGGIPDDAYEAIEGDNKEACAALKKKNKRENPKLGEMFLADEAAIRDKLYQAAAAIDEMGDSKPEDIRRKEAAFRNAQSNYDFQKAWDLADLWCAAFVIQKRFPELTSDLRSPTAVVPAAPSSLNAQPLATQGGLFGGTEELPKAKAKKTKAPSRADSEIPFGITTQYLRDFVVGGALPDGLLAEAKRLADQYQFFHWHLAFPEVFAQGGFDISLGNPPWERIQPEAVMFFSASHPELLRMKRSDRSKAIAQLADTDPSMFRAWSERRTQDLNVTKFLKGSGRFPRSTTKNVNSYAVFQELTLQVISAKGAAGLILQSGIATDEINKDLFRYMIENGKLVSLLDFENRIGLFPDVDSRMRFCLLICKGAADDTQPPPRFAFGLESVEQLKGTDRSFTLSREQFAILAPNTGLCPTFRSRADAELVLKLFATTGVLVREVEPKTNYWGISIRRVFSMAYDSGDFIAGLTPPEPNEDFTPVFEAKLFHQYDHRFAVYRIVGAGDFECSSVATEARGSSNFATPRFWAKKTEAVRRLDSSGWSHRYLIGYRDITNSTNERTCIACILPESAPDDTIRVLFSAAAPAEHAVLLSNLNSFALDFAARNSVASTHLSEYLAKQLPVFPPQVYSHPCLWTEATMTVRDWLLPRVLELTYTAWDLEAFAQDCGRSGPPFRWDEERRFLLRCELDAAFFHLYLGSEEEWRKQPAALTQAFPTPRAAVFYIMDTFPIVKRKDEARTEQKNAEGEVVKPGRYITKDTILEIYDALAEAIKTGQPYQTRLDPPPADPRCCHPPKQTAIPAPTWLDRPLVLPTSRRIGLAPDRYRATIVPHLLYQAGGSVSFERFRKAYWLLTEPKTLERYASGTVGEIARGWARTFRDKLEKDRFIEHLKGAVGRQLHFIHKGNERWLELRDSNVADDEHVIFDARLALLVADLWPVAEPITPLAPAEEITIQELEAVL